MSTTPPGCPLFFSDYFNVKPIALEKYGAFDVSIVNDLPLFIDPFLLFNSKKGKYRQIHDNMIRYLVYLKDEAAAGEITEGREKALFTFPEIKQNWFGFSEEGNKGHGLGRKFSKSLISGFSTVFRNFGTESVSKSSHIEKLCLLKPGIGRDFISDFTTNMCAGFLADYTEKFTHKHIGINQRREFTVRKSAFNYETGTWIAKSYQLPCCNDDYIILTPKDILTRDDAWINQGDLFNGFERVIQSVSNAELRDCLNEYFHKQIEKYKILTKEKEDRCVVRTIEKYPQVIDHFIQQKEHDGNKAASIAGERVSFVDQVFVKNIKSLLGDVLTPSGFLNLRANTYQESLRRLLFLKDIIENKGGHKIFYNKGKPVQREEDIHILYRLTWAGTLKDVTAEANDGRGPVDYKISEGSSDKTLVEFKLATNNHLKRNIEKQCAIYEKASNPTHPSIMAIFYFSKSQLAKVTRILKDMKIDERENIVLFDCRKDNKPSGSKA